MASRRAISAVICASLLALGLIFMRGSSETLSRATASATMHSFAKPLPRGQGSFRVSERAMGIRKVPNLRGCAATSADMPKTGDYYEVNIEKPIGISFARGNDGRAYIIKLDERKGNLDPRCEVGDRLDEISASFGDDVWKAENFGQIMYAIRTRVGGLYFKFEKRDGDMSFLEIDTKDVEFRKERRGGNYGAGTREVQMRNYITSKENERARNEVFNTGLELYEQGKYEDAIYKFEDVLGMEPPNYVGDDFRRITPMYEIAGYNIACCFSKLRQWENSLGALRDCLNSGYEDFEKVRNGDGLAELREAEEVKFQALLDRYDEPVFDPKLVEGFKNLFGFGKK
ncbi:hypothetical protein AAMO2058_001224800 [Amorphochlora amoebiformis]